MDSYLYKQINEHLTEDYMLEIAILVEKQNKQEAIRNVREKLKLSHKNAELLVDDICEYMDYILNHEP